MSIQPCKICGKEFDAWNRFGEKIWCDDCFEDGEKKIEEIKAKKEAAETKQAQELEETNLKIQNIKLTTTPQYPNKEKPPARRPGASWIG